MCLGELPSADVYIYFGFFNLFKTQGVILDLLKLFVIIKLKPSFGMSQIIVGPLEPLSLDIDECETSTDNCDVNAHCNNTKGSFRCTCKVGYFGDGVLCKGALSVRKRNL